MRRFLKSGQAIIVCIIFSTSTDVFAQLKEEVEEGKIKALAQEVIKQKTAKKNISSSVQLTTGFDTNPRLAIIRKPDIYEELLYSCSYSQPFWSGFRFGFNYDLVGTEYNELTDLSNILNHVKFALTKAFNKRLYFGGGYDGTLLYYRNNDPGDFVFHKNFIYLRQRLTKRLYHQIKLENGYKDYTNQEALGETSDTFLTSKREDQRQAVEYSIGTLLTPKLFLKLRTNYSTNDSNAQFMDFYDYNSVDVISNMYYKLSRKILLSWNFSYTEKDYKSRLVFSRSYEQQDHIYSTGVGLNLKINKDNNLSVNYTYHQGTSNDPLSEYTGNAVNCGWRYNF